MVASWHKFAKWSSAPSGRHAGCDQSGMIVEAVPRETVDTSTDSTKKNAPTAPFTDAHMGIRVTRAMAHAPNLPTHLRIG